MTAATQSLTPTGIAPPPKPATPPGLAKHPPFQMFLAETEVAQFAEAVANAKAFLEQKAAAVVADYEQWWEAKGVWKRRGESMFGE